MDIKNYYANKFSVMVAQLNPKEIVALDNLSQKYSYEELAKAIDSLSFRPKPTQLESTLTELLSKKHKNQEEPKKVEKVEKKVEEQKPQRTSVNIPDAYKQIFIKYNIPKNIIDFDILSSLDRYLKTVYLSDLIAEYLYSNLPKEKLSQYNKIANEHFSKMKLSEREKPEAYKIYIKMLIKKELGIYV
jgi:hypothetical protein